MTAGANFQLFYQKSFLLPHRRATWIRFTERLDEAAEFADAIDGRCGDIRRSCSTRSVQVAAPARRPGWAHGSTDLQGHPIEEPIAGVDNLVGGGSGGDRPTQSPRSKHSGACSATPSSTRRSSRCRPSAPSWSTERAAEQRKLVTVLFADLVDFTVLSQQLDAEDVRTVIDAYFQRWHDHIEANGGVVEKFIGDAVMAVFGLHRADEADPHRAIRAALAMRASLERAQRRRRDRPHDVTLEMRVGIDTGEVVVSTLGDRPGQEFVVVGDIVNRASRIQGAAPRGGVLVSADTYRHVRGSFDVQPMTGLQLKGIAHPVNAYLIENERARGFRLDDGRGVEGVETPDGRSGDRAAPAAGPLRRGRRRAASGRWSPSSATPASASRGCCPTSDAGSPTSPSRCGGSAAGPPTPARACPTPCCTICSPPASTSTTATIRRTYGGSGSAVSNKALGVGPRRRRQGPRARPLAGLPDRRAATSPRRVRHDPQNLSGRATASLGEYFRRLVRAGARRAPARGPALGRRGDARADRRRRRRAPRLPGARRRHDPPDAARAPPALG